MIIFITTSHASQMLPTGLVVEFELLDRQPTDPPDVPSLQDVIAALMSNIELNRFEVCRNGVEIITKGFYLVYLH